MYRRGLLLSATAGALALQAQAPKTHLKKGDKAPEFSLRSTVDPKTQATLSQHAGKNSVVLAFFPAAFTGG
jgi:hypothetical protein